MTILGWHAADHTAPVFEGDTIYARSEVLETRESKSRPDAGIVEAAGGRGLAVVEAAMRRCGVILVKHEGLPKLRAGEPGGRTVLLGLRDGAVRVGIVHYNTAEEVDRLLESLELIAAGAAAVV